MANKEEINNKVPGMSIAALVLGIVSIVFWCVWFISIPCSILGLIFGILGIKKARKAGFFVTYNHPEWSLEHYPEYSKYKGMNAMEIRNGINDLILSGSKIRDISFDQLDVIEQN